jgi:phytoene synthase
MRNAATALYAFCREADDLIDLGTDAEASLAMVRARVDEIFTDAPLSAPADRALRAVARHYSLPRPLLDALIEGFAWDTSQRSYHTLDEVEDYAARVAGTVGAMMSVLMGARDPAVLARACDLGVAMQLTNICRDVGEDARAGRCYLPQDWLASEGVAVDQLLEPASAAGIRRVVDRLLGRAATLYRRADTGIAMLPLNCQRGIRMARHLYAAIGDEISRQDSYRVEHRAFVPAKRKLALLARHWLPQSAGERHLLHAAPLDSTAWLVDAVQAVTPARPIEVTRGLMQPASGTRNELLTTLQVIDRLEHAKRNRLQVGSGKLPLHYAQAMRVAESDNHPVGAGSAAGSG